MSRNKILIVSTYPIRVPQHGGQKRVAAMAESYRQAGYEVKTVAIFMDDFYPGIVGGDDIALPWHRYEKRMNAGFISDLMTAEVLVGEMSVRRKFLDSIKDFQPNFVQIEQVFLYKAVKEILDSEGWSGKLINSTHNIEYELKKQILVANTEMSNGEITQITQQVKEIERFAAQDADWSIACTEDDAMTLEKLGARDVIVAANGIAPLHANQGEVQKIRQLLRTQRIEKIVVFVGSAHPPNLTGFIEMVGAKVGFLNDNERIVVLGGVADMLRGFRDRLPNYLRLIFDEKVSLLGRVEEDTLTAYIKLSNVIILPIVEGSGSNLKTAEAISADKSVVGTDKAFHSYEWYKVFPNLSVANNNEAFRRGIRIQLDSKPQSRTLEQQKDAKKVLWTNALQPIIARIQGE